MEFTDYMWLKLIVVGLAAFIAGLMGWLPTEQPRQGQRGKRPE